jgi:hypothetical protein
MQLSQILSLARTALSFAGGISERQAVFLFPIMTLFNGSTRLKEVTIETGKLRSSWQHFHYCSRK